VQSEVRAQIMGARSAGNFFGVKIVNGRTYKREKA
jgi:hypothetical protein